jgi:hypothetical protein
MDMPFIGAEAIRDGILTRGQLRWNYTAMHPGVYLANGAEETLEAKAFAAWLRTRRRGVIAGRTASVLHGAKWCEPDVPIEIIANHTRPRTGVIVREERLAADEIVQLGELPVTSTARTALDLARHLPREEAVAAVDALAAATGLTFDDLLPLLERYRGAKWIRRARVALDLVDGGAQSPQETWLRLLLVDAGYPRPRTQIRVTDGDNTAFLDMGYDEIKVGLDYEGSHHSEQRKQYVHDIGRSALVDGQGWLDIKVVAEHGRAYIFHRLNSAFEQRGWRRPPAISA